MSVAELLPALEALPRADKLRAACFLLAGLAREEGIELLERNQDYPVWTPIHAFSAADTLLKALSEEQSVQQ
ncbi:MAG: hypothetical protein GY862_18410 [Gammaproteobacteria bacterium]|nr:hypothetical protein [Gammaproteobacteria bacterium]